jgi:acetylornithine deacetylase/succinyl-diaminopimelate desuccinylase-like protein
MLRNLVTPTMLRASDKENVIAQTAEAGLDMRLLPDEDVGAFVAGLERIIDDERVRLEIPDAVEKSSVSPFAGGFYDALAGVLKRHVPESVSVPMLTPGATDSCFFRRKGVAAYGLMPIVIDSGEISRMHGIDERISLENLQLGTQIVYDVLSAMCL